MNTYRVEAQAIAELDFTGASFTVTVTAPRASTRPLAARSAARSLAPASGTPRTPRTPRA